MEIIKIADNNLDRRANKNVEVSGLFLSCTTSLVGTHYNRNAIIATPPNIEDK